MGKSVHLGYEVGSGKDVSIPLRHMVVTGQSQEAGKTTTLEALIARASLPALAFVTKRGERSFADGRRIPPYFRERADWEFVVSVLEATLRERLKFERAWIMRASKGARTLAEVQRNVREAMKSAKGLSADVYLTLDAYLEIVVPRVASVDFASSIDLVQGLNVVDLSDRDRFPPELQSLVMRSVLEWVYEHADGTITIIPEAWEFLPQGRGSPVKLAAVELIRKGAGLQNYVWLDSQDIGGVDKELLRSCPVWLLGVQREANEIKRVLENIPAGIAKPKPADVATLRKGEFFACYGRHVIKTYVQPAWMLPGEACGIAMGNLQLDQVISQPPIPAPIPIEEPMSKTTDERLDILIGLLTPKDASVQLQPTSVSSTPEASVSSDEEALYQRFKVRLLKEAQRDPKVMQVFLSRPELSVEVERQVIRVDGRTLRGRIARLIADEFFSQARTSAQVLDELLKRGADRPSNIELGNEMKVLCDMGFFTRENKWYSLVTDMKVNVVQK
jgi:hypothetical protein